MAVISCHLKPGSRRGPVRRRDGGRSYYEIYLVRTNDPDDDGLVVEKAAGLPQIGHGYPEDSAAVVDEIDPQESDQDPIVRGAKYGQLWEVQIRYTSASIGRGGQSGDVLSYPPRRSWSTIAYRIYPVADLDGKAFRNSAGDPFDPPPPIFELHDVLTIEVNRLSHDQGEVREYKNSINADPITVDRTTYPPHAGRLNQYDAVQDFLSGGEPFWRKTYVIEFNPQLWYPWREIDRGPRHKVQGQEGLFLPKDDNDVTFDGQLLLDGNGFPLFNPAREPGGGPGGEGGSDPITGLPLHQAPPGNPHLIEFRLYKERPFEALQLPLG